MTLASSTSSHVSWPQKDNIRESKMSNMRKIGAESDKNTQQPKVDYSPCNRKHLVSEIWIYERHTKRRPWLSDGRDDCQRHPLRYSASEIRTDQQTNPPLGKPHFLPNIIRRIYDNFMTARICIISFILQY